MKLTRFFTVVVCRVVTSILFAIVLGTALTQDAYSQSELLLGAWKINIARSLFSTGPAPKSGLLIYEAIGNGVFRATTETMSAEGKPNKSTRTIRYDGRLYPETGANNVDASAYTRVDEYTEQFTRTKSGKITETGTRVVSRDGKTYTITSSGINAQGQRFNNVIVFEKQ